MTTTYTYSGTTARTYTQYLDLGNAGHTLYAQPYGAYIPVLAQPWTGQLGSVPGDGQWSIPQGPSSPFTPGKALVGQATPGYPGQELVSGRLDETILAAPARPRHLPEPRLITGRETRLHVSPHRRRTRTRQPAAAVPAWSSSTRRP